MMPSRRHARGLVATVAALCALVGGMSLASAQEAPSDEPSLPITYRFNDPNPWVKNSVYAVHQGDDTTVIVRHPSREEPDFDNPGWFAGEATDGRLVRVRQAHRPVLVKPGAGSYRPGTREQRRRDDEVSYVTYDQVETALTRGDDDRTVAGRATNHYKLKVRFRATRHDAKLDQVGQTTRSYEHDLWIAEDLPYSPAFALPFRVIGRLFVEDDATKLGEYILDQVRPKLGDKGLVLRVEFRKSSDKKPAYVMQAEALGSGEARRGGLPTYPMLDDETFAEIAPVTILSRMLEPADKGAAKASKLELEYSGDASGKLEGSAVYGTNKHGDFALLLSVPASFGRADAKKHPKQVFVLLMRPMHGLPGEGKFEVGDAADDIESMSTEQLEALSQKFTVMALIREQAKDSDHPDVYALLDVEHGEVKISKADQGLDGAVRLTLRGVGLSKVAREATVKVEAGFSANKALENVGSSKITRVLTR